MQITETKVKVPDLCENYSDNGDGGVFRFDGFVILCYYLINNTVCSDN